MSLNKELLVFKSYPITRIRNGLLCFLASLKTTVHHFIILVFYKLPPIWGRRFKSLPADHNQKILIKPCKRLHKITRRTIMMELSKEQFFTKVKLKEKEMLKDFRSSLRVNATLKVFNEMLNETIEAHSWGELSIRFEGKKITGVEERIIINPPF
ncbi:putative membrane protein [Halobacteriovorax marinus SJ]|uniref:Membrane protein n=2 Tax=Halobacteriovorax marinus TaxID=97084 RepID=E1X5T9_HALMS|nr:putative membrane protein [Halobacteriovorax marinus SJ]